MPLLSKHHDKRAVNADYQPTRTGKTATTSHYGPIADTSLGPHHDMSYPTTGGTTGQGYDHGEFIMAGSSPGHKHGPGVGGGTVNAHEAPGIGEPALPPTSVLSGPGHSRTGRGLAITGKFEHAVGALIGSESLKAKGLQKEQEVNAIKLQGQELAEAERLEREAMARRERAVAHGAHPDNKYLGGVPPQGDHHTDQFA